jgi:hypothetical protein
MDLQMPNMITNGAGCLVSQTRANPTMSRTSFPLAGYRAGSGGVPWLMAAELIPLIAW